MHIGILKGFLAFLSLIPLKTLHLMGGVLGTILSFTPNSSKKITEENLKLCFPNKNSKEIRDLTKKSLIETSKSLFESGHNWLNFPKSGVGKLVTVVGLENVIKALEEKRGIILFSPHMGNIEVLVSYLASNFTNEVTIPYTPAKITSLDKIIKTSRESMGANMVRANSSGVRTLLKSLKKGGLLIMASDQVPKKKNGVISSFFGIPALSVTLISSLGKRTGSPCVSVCCLRQPSGKGYKIIFSRKINALNNLEVQEGVNLMNRQLEECIMAAPEQYAWEYKRFKHSNFKSPY